MTCCNYPGWLSCRPPRDSPPAVFKCQVSAGVSTSLICPAFVSITVPARADFPFAEIPDNETDTWYYLTLTLNTIPSSNIDLYSERRNGFFEPREDHKGNVARAMFYFYTMPDLRKMYLEDYPTWTAIVTWGYGAIYTYFYLYGLYICHAFIFSM